MTRVLVIDDEKLVRRGIIEGTNWEKLGCCVVGEAKDGEEGVRLTETLHPDLLISDIRMGKMDGISMLEKIREKNIEVKVIFLTAYSDFSYARSALRLQAADYLLKPYGDGALEKAIRRLLGRDILEGGTDFEAEHLPFSLKKKTSDMNRYVQAAISYVEQHYRDRQIGISDIAAKLEVSEGHLSRLFKKDTDMSINTYVTHYRIRTAMRLLKDVRYRVYEAANLVGYQDIGYFSNLFKKLVGMTPSEYREMKTGQRDKGI